MKDYSPSYERNNDDILGVLKEVLPNEGLILEVAGGTGQHATCFAPHFPDARWQTSDIRPESLASMRAWREETGLPNLEEPVELDLTRQPWPVDRADAMVAINMLHASPWQVGLGLLHGAGRVLTPGAPLYYYGAFLRDDRETAPSNLEFDVSLRERDPSWGLRRLTDVLEVAGEQGLELDRLVDMPRNNCSLILRKTS
ncbi:MAG: DUF938 domain-containing protein [Acidobacteriota bacterium]